MNQETASLLQRFGALQRHMGQTIVGQGRLVERLLVALLADGHVLLEGLPGLAKTTAVHTLAEAMALRFKRIQFTPDLIPGDITGSDIFLAHEGSFRFIEGPIFNDIVLADEINRAPPKVQSALLEAMQERQVTVGAATRPLSPLFMVIATQNPLDQEGTYPLPEAQIDRFLMKVEIDYPEADEELEILRRETERLRHGAPEREEALLEAEQIGAARRQVNAIHMAELLERYIVTLVGATRDPAPYWPEASDWIAHGASPRATLALARCARALAFLRQRDFVEPADILDVAPEVLGHRIGLTFAARAEGVDQRRIVDQLLQRIPIP